MWLPQYWRELNLQRIDVAVKFGDKVKYFRYVLTVVGPNDNRDAFNWRHRSNGDHSVGDSMPGTVGDAQRVLHDRYGQTPVVDETTEVPSEHQERRTEETTEDNGEAVEDLVAKLRS